MSAAQTSLAARPGTACEPWCDPSWCSPGRRCSTAPVKVDTAAAGYSLSLRRWWVDPDSDSCEPCPQPSYLSFSVSHKTEIAEAEPPQNGDLPLTLCAVLSRGEMVELIEAQRCLLARLSTGEVTR